MDFIKKVNYQTSNHILIPVDTYRIDKNILNVSAYYTKLHFDYEPVDNRILEYFKIWYQTNKFQSRNIILKILIPNIEYILVENMLWDSIPTLDSDFYSVSFRYDKIENISTYFRRIKIINAV